MLHRILSRFSLALIPAILGGLMLAAPLRAETTGADSCTGVDLYRGMSAEARAELTAATKAVPFPAGNHWQATKGDSTIHVIGTFHMFDPRMNAHMRKLMPTLHKADVVLLEATEAELAQLKDDMSRKPEMLFVTGPTLPDRLPPEEWENLKAEMGLRGIPGIFAAKFQPWYVTMILSMPPCAATPMPEGAAGLDHLIMTAAHEMGTPTRALEPHDTVFRLFGSLSPDDQLEMVRSALTTAPMATDLLTTMKDAYFRQEHRLIWEISRQISIDTAKDPRKAEADLALMEEALIYKRNEAWMDRILAEAPGRTLVVAVGAGHLAGHRGLLNLLAEVGYEIRQQDF